MIFYIALSGCCSWALRSWLLRGSTPAINKRPHLVVCCLKPTLHLLSQQKLYPRLLIHLCRIIVSQLCCPFSSSAVCYFTVCLSLSLSAWSKIYLFAQVPLMQLQVAAVPIPECIYTAASYCCLYLCYHISLYVYVQQLYPCLLSSASVFALLFSPYLLSLFLPILAASSTQTTC